MGYKVKLCDDGIVQSTFIGDMDDLEFERYVREIMSCAETELAEKPRLILSDARRAGKLSSKARKTFAELSKDPLVKKVAVIGGPNRYVRVLVGFINKAVGRNNVRFFDSEEEALAWLKAS